MIPVRLAVIGAGHLGRFHALVAARLPQIELVAVADPVAASRERVAAEAHTRAVADYREILDTIDAAVVAVPTTLHHQIGCELLEHGVALLIEKPLADCEAAATDLAKRAERKRVPLAVGHVERFNPAFCAVRPQLLRPKYIEATRLSGYSFRSTDIGVVLDVMIHDLDLVLSLVEAPLKRVDAIGLSVLSSNEDMATARLVFENGCVAQLTASRISFEQRRQMQVFTEHAYTLIDFAACRAEVVEPREDVLQRKFDFGELSTVDVAYWKEHLFEELLVRTAVEPEPVNAIEQEQLNLVACLRKDEALAVDGRVGRDAVAAAEQILGVLEQHRWDGAASGRRGARALPAWPVLEGPPQWHSEPDQRRRAG